MIPLRDISPGALRPLRRIDAESVAELAVSIAELGILKPLSVFRSGDTYELISGERRLRAAAMAGLDEVPCIVLDIGAEDVGLISLMENLRRGSLDVIGDAEGLFILIETFGLSQEECARRLGRSQPAIANRLRLLKLPPDVRERMRGAGLGERHGRALLRLEESGRQRAALLHMLQNQMTVAAAEEYVEHLMRQDRNAETTVSAQLSVPAQPRGGEGQKTVFIMKDLRIFLNTLSRGVEAIRSAGIPASLECRESGGEIVLTVKIAKAQSGEALSGVQVADDFNQ